MTRKVGERVYIGDNITLVILDIKGGQIRLGVEAPREVEIYRSELLDSKPYPMVMNPKPDHVRTAWGELDVGDNGGDVPPS